MSQLYLEITSIGVIRCVEKQAVLGKANLEFFRFDLGNLSFIAEQLRSVLQMIDVQLKREEGLAISVHDLKSAGTTIRDASNSLSKKLKTLGVYEKIKYPIDDTYNTSEFLLALLKQTGRIPGTNLPCNPKLVNLEGIVARLKAMFYNITINHKLRLSFSGFDSLGMTVI